MDPTPEEPDVVLAHVEALAPLAEPRAELTPMPAGGWSELTPVEVQLRSLAKGRKTPAQLVLRARIVLGVLFEGRSKSAVAQTVGVTRDTVRLWVRRFEAWPEVESLQDQPRTGRPCRISVQDQAVVLSLACQKPEDIGRCEGRMTQMILKEEAEKRGSVMSRSSVQRILATAEVQPHHERYYLFTRKDDATYVARRDDLCALYSQPLPLDEVVVCMDEKTGLQVLGMPKKVPQGGWQGATSGQPARLEQHYTRFGSRTLVGAVRPDTGRLVAAQVFASGTYKTEQTIDFLRMIRQALPSARVIHLVWDNGSTHVSKEMKAFLASEEGKVFQVHYTPVHASWLNLAENFLSRFSRRYLHTKRWTGLSHFDQDMGRCFEAYQQVAKPMRWRYNPRERAETRARHRSLPPCPPPRPLSAAC